MEEQKSQEFERACQLVLNECASALNAVDTEQVFLMKTRLLQAERVFFVGVGRVLLALECMAKRLSHLGINCCIVGQVTEPAITEKDVLIVGSGSGSSLFPAAIAKKAKKIGATVIHIGSNPCGEVQAVTDLMVRIPVQTKLGLDDEISSVQPMTSLFEQSLLLLGDVLAILIIKEKGIVISDLWKFHANLE